MPIIFARVLGDLSIPLQFITMAGPHVLLFTSSKNDAYNDRLNMPAELKSLTETALVTPISIEDYQKYAEMALGGQQAEWL